MSDLSTLLAEVRAADPADRIDYRDRVAAYGAEAIDPMREWLNDPQLGGFAVRVMRRVSQDPAVRSDVIRALEAADLDRLPPVVKGDVVELLADLAPPRRPGGGQAAVERWPRDERPSPLELRFHDAMVGIFHSAGDATRRVRPDGTVQRGYWAHYFLRGVRNHGGLPYARQLLRARGTTDGFQRLKEEDRLDLTMEALILKAEYAPLFTDDERSIAAQRLRVAGYEPHRA